MSCKNQKEQTLTNEVSYDAVLKDSFFFSNGWSYPSLTVKIAEGKFDNGYGTKTSADDTLHLFHTAAILTMFDSLENEIFLKENCVNCKINYGKAFLEKDTLCLEFYELTPVSYDNLVIKIVNNRFFSTYSAGSPPNGNRFYYFEKQKLIFQKEYYMKGDTIKGYLDFQGHKPNFVHLKGFFKIPFE